MKRKSFIKSTPRRVKRRGARTVAHTAAKVRGLAKLRPKNIWAALHRKKTWIRIGQVAGVFLLLIILVFAWYAKDLPSPNKINARLSAQTTKIYDRSGQHVLMEVFGDKNRSLIEFNQMPDSIKQATVAIEDKDFYKHGAFSIPGITRAVYYTIFKRNTQGGSTITQQYVKNALLTKERSLSRKIKELILSIEIEQTYKKDDILKLYLNEIPYGSTAYGIQAAAKTYFSKDAKDLTLDESAMLAAMPQAPTYYSPYGQHKDALIIRQRKILDLMVDQGYITKQQAEDAKKIDVLSKVKRQNLYANVYAPHFVQYVREQLESKYGVKRTNEGGLKVITTLDYDKQKIAEEAIEKNMASVRAYGGSNAALVSADPKNGEVLSMVGSYDYSEPNFGSYNVAIANRQPGSSFKPITYSTLLKKNYGAGTTMYDVITDFGGGYKPRNYTGRTYGVQSVRTVLASSLNIPAVKALYMAGIPEALNTAKDLGFTTLNRSVDNYGLSLTLGSGEVKLTEMVNAFSAFATNGEHRKQVYVLKVTDGTGEVLEENKPEKNKPKQALDPQIAYIINSILSDNGSRSALGVFPANNPLTLGSRPVAAKTGTTEDYKDAWTMGYTTRVVTGVWAGNNDNRPMTQAASIVSAPVWHDYMVQVTQNDPVENFDKPNGLKTVTLDADTGKLPTNATKRQRSDIFPSWYQPPKASNTINAKVDKVSGKLATECTPADAIEEKTIGIMNAEIPSTDPAYPRWQPPVAALAASLGYTSGGIPTEKDTTHKCGDIRPNISLSVNPPSGSTFTLTANVTPGTFGTTRLIFFMDGGQISEIATSPSGGSYPISHTPGSTGSHSFSAKIVDSGLYSNTSNTVTVNVIPPPNASLSCSFPTCSVSASGNGGAAINYVDMFYNNINQGRKYSSPYNWGGWFSSLAAKATVTDNYGSSTTRTFP
ncbi:MAG: transglycosylase domain-containing protein [bacterium]|nr:transglycosylase domain-containing protein [bacterium]